MGSRSGGREPLKGWLGELYEAEYEALVNHLMWSMGIWRRPLAEDLASEALKRMLEAGKRPRNPRAKLYRIADNLAKNFLRDLARRAKHPDHFLPKPWSSSTPQQDLECQELEEALNGGLARGADTPREVFELWCRGMSAEEIAEALGMSLNGVNVNLCRARKLLEEARRLHDEGPSPQA